MLKVYSWILAFACCLLLAACEKNPVEPADQSLQFNLSAQRVLTKSKPERLLFTAVPSENVLLENVTITDPAGESIIFKLQTPSCARGSLVSLQHAGESYAKRSGRYLFEFRGHLSAGPAFNLIENYDQL